MYAIIINAVAIVVGSAIGALFQRGISEKYVNVLNTAMGLCAITLGMNVLPGALHLLSVAWRTCGHSAQDGPAHGESHA